MKVFCFFIGILKEVFVDVEIVSYKLMVCVGMICCVVGGIYNYLLVGLCLICKVEVIVCEEMNWVGVIELLMLVV